MQPSFDLARAEYTRGVAIHQQLDHQRRVKRLFARAAFCVAGVERFEVQYINRVADEVSQVPLGQPSCSDAGGSISCCGS